MKKHSKNDYPIRTLCFLIEQGSNETPFIQAMKQFAEKVNIKESGHGNNVPPDPIQIENKIRY